MATACTTRHHAGPPADIIIPSGSPARWLPGKGLALPKPAMLKTAAPVRKLNAIIRNARRHHRMLGILCHPLPAHHPAHLLGRQRGLLGETRPGQPAQLLLRLPFLQYRNWRPRRLRSAEIQSAQTAGRRTTTSACSTRWSPGMATSRAFTSTGNWWMMRHYKWQVENWLPDLPLTFGNEPDGQRPFLGSLLPAGHLRLRPRASANIAQLPGRAFGTVRGETRTHGLTRTYTDLHGLTRTNTDRFAPEPSV